MVRKRREEGGKEIETFTSHTAVKHILIWCLFSATEIF